MNMLFFVFHFMIWNFILTLAYLQDCDYSRGACPYESVDPHGFDLVYFDNNRIDPDYAPIGGPPGNHFGGVLKCGAPPNINHGRYRGQLLESYKWGSEISYTCDVGYNMANHSDAKLRCTGSGRWSKQSQSCLYAESCRSNPCQNNGECTNLLGTYKCTCATGWLGKRCNIAVTCGKPKEIKDGSYHNSSNKYKYGSEIIYSCDKGYNMTEPSDAKRRCNGSGLWSGKIPKCLYSESCKSKPCENNGTCTNLLGSYKCTCTHSWSGKHCDNGADTDTIVVGVTLGFIIIVLIVALLAAIKRIRRDRQVKSKDSDKSEYTIPNVSTITLQIYDSTIESDTKSEIWKSHENASDSYE